MAQQEAFEDALNGLLFVVAEAVDRFELQPQPGHRGSGSRHHRRQNEGAPRRHTMALKLQHLHVYADDVPAETF